MLSETKVPARSMRPLPSTMIGGAVQEAQWAAIGSIAAKIGYTAETLRKWVRQAERDVGQRSGASADKRERIKELERKVRELRQANKSVALSRGSCGGTEADEALEVVGEPTQQRLDALRRIQLGGERLAMTPLHDGHNGLHLPPLTVGNAIGCDTWLAEPPDHLLP